MRACHERWDGAGYPDGLAGEEIPIIARIVYCCDAFNAMTTQRPYRQPFSVAEALEELRRNAGTQFDPSVVAVVAAVVTSTMAAELESALPATLVSVPTLLLREARAAATAARVRKLA